MNRDDLAQQFSGEGAELGVADGVFSAEILSNPLVTRLWSIDRWSDHHDETEYQKASELLGWFGNRSCILRRSFSEATAKIADGMLDFIYVDGYAHTGQDGGRTLREWWPKVRSGGIFAGHDYHPRWQPTIDAVDAFVRDNGLTLNVTDGDEFLSWWVVKKKLPDPSKADDGPIQQIFGRETV